MEIFSSDDFGKLMAAIIEGAVFSAGAGIQLLCCLFVKSAAGKIIPSALGRLASAALIFFGGVFVLYAFALDGWDALGVLALGVVTFALATLPVIFTVGTAAGWIIYALIRSQGVKSQYR